MKKLTILCAQLLLALAPAVAQGTGRVVAEEKCEGPVYKQGEVSRRPVIRHKPDPGLTDEARANGVSGTVSLTAVLCHTGRVTDIHVLQALPDGLTERAVAAARRIEFTPAEKDGRRVATHLRLEYNFNVMGGKLEAPSAAYNNRLVESLIIEGNRRLTDEEIIRHLKTRPGAAYKQEQVLRDLQTLLDLSVFDTTQTRVSIEEGPRGGVVVIFLVAELPMTRDLTFKGLRGVTEADVLKAWRERGIRLCKGCPFDSSKASAASEAVRMMVAALGWPNATVDVRVDEVSQVSVALTFVVFPEGQ